MNIVLVVLLGGLWAVILLPRLLRERRESSAFGTVGAFERSMVRLGGGVPSRTGPLGRSVGVPSAAQRRRHKVLQALGGVAAVSFLVSIAVGGWFLWLLTVVSLGALGTYVMLLKQLAQEAAMRRKVRQLPVRQQIVVEYDQDDQDEALEA